MGFKFSEKTPEQIDADVRKVLERHRDYPDMYSFVEALCVANAKPFAQVANEIKEYTNLTSALVGQQSTQYGLAKTLWEQNPLHLPKEGEDGAIAKQILFLKATGTTSRFKARTKAENTEEGKDKEGSVLWTERMLNVRRRAVIHAVQEKVARYQAGEISINELPRFQEVMKELFPKAIFSSDNTHQAILSKERASVEAGKPPLLSAADKTKLTPKRVGNFFNEKKPLPHEYKAIFQAAEIPEEAQSAFFTLPANKPKKETAFTQALQEMMSRYIPPNQNPNQRGKPSQKDLAFFTKQVDPDNEGISNITISQLIAGVNHPSEHSIRLLTKAFASRVLGKTAPITAENLPDDIKQFVASANYQPGYLLRDVHQVIAQANSDTPFFSLLKDMRTAQDINISAVTIENGLGIKNIYSQWEAGVAFPGRDSVLDVADHVIGLFQDILSKKTPPDRLNEIEAQTIKTIAALNLETQGQRREELKKQLGESHIKANMRRRNMEKNSSIGSNDHGIV